MHHPSDPRDSLNTDDAFDLDEPLSDQNQGLLAVKDERQLESQSPDQDSVPVEYTISTSRKLSFLALYFLLNLSVTLSNKALLKIVRSSSSRPCLMMTGH
jgi:hypothetical protein